MFSVNGNYPQADYGLTNTGPFKNLQGNYYWSGTEYSADSDYAWYFGTYSGYQGAGGKGYDYFGLAVLPGDVAETPTPIPGTVLLFGSGLGGLIGMMRRRG